MRKKELKGCQKVMPERERKKVSYKGIKARWTAAFLAACLMVGACTACGHAGDANMQDGAAAGGEKPRADQPQEVKGAYVETEISLPEEWTEQSIAQVYVVDDELRMLVFGEEEGMTTLQEWKYDGEFSEITEEWLGALRLPAVEWMEASLLRSETGGSWLYACYPDEGEDHYKGHLWKASEGQAVEITPKGWTVPNEQYGYYPIIRAMAAREDGTLAALNFDTVDLLSGEDGSVEDSISAMSGSYGEEMAAEGNTLYVIATNDAGSAESVEQHGPDGETAVIPLAQKGDGYVYLSALSDGGLIAMSRDGIFRYGSEEKTWETLMEGADASFGLPDTRWLGMAAREDGTVYALISQGEELSLFQYAFDPDAVRRTVEVLTIYTVDESYLLQQAAILYHREHPEVKVEIDAAYSLSERYSPHDYDSVYRDLNTVLLGEDAPDMIVLDHLDADTYVDKGILLDIDDVVAPLEESRELLANITGVFAREDGARYVVPLQFRFPIALGREISAENMETMESLAAFLSSAQESYMGEQTAEELIDQFYPVFCGELVKEGGLDREELATRLTYLKAIADNCGIVEQHENGGANYGTWDLSSRAKLAFDEASGFKGSMLPISMVETIEGEFTAFENVFTPGLCIGVCAKSERVETALDFLRFALSQKVQDTDYREGFPVNAQSLQMQKGQDRSDSEAVASVASADGEYEEFYIKEYSEESEERLVELCRGLVRPTMEDAQIRAVLLEALPAYLRGDSPLEETVDAVEAGLKMYLAE